MHQCRIEEISSQHAAAVHAESNAAEEEEKKQEEDEDVVFVFNDNAEREQQGAQAVEQHLSARCSRPLLLSDSLERAIALPGALRVCVQCVYIDSAYRHVSCPLACTLSRGAS